MQTWLIDNGVQVATLITLIVLVAKASRWSGITDARLKGLEDWMKRHIEFTHRGP